MLRSSRCFGFIVLLLIYSAAALLGIAVFRLLPGWGFYQRLFAADAAATLLVWSVGLPLRNASVYDPYWSVAPIVLLSLGAQHLGVLFTPGALMMLAVVALWGIRLTAHWSTTFVNLKAQDWRYSMLKSAHPRLWFLINLFGINLFPTVVVFLALAPAFEFIVHFESVNPGVFLGLLVSLAAAAIQLIADMQMRKFRRMPENKGRVNRTGLWRYSRHPNYLGEILMWWGVCLAALFAPGASVLYIAGALVNTLMFVFISIPMMERRQLYGKSDYADYREAAGMLLPKLRKRGEATDAMSK